MSVIQSIQFSRNIWSKKDVVQWLLDHNLYPIKAIQTYPHYYRTRLFDPREFKRLRNKKLPEHGLILTFGFR